MLKLSNFLFLFLCSFLLNAAFSVGKIRGLFRRGVNPQDVHVGEVSRCGGLAIVVGLALWTFLFSVGDGLPFYYKFVFISFGAFLVGFIDDLVGHLDQKIRIFLICVLSLVFGVSIGWLDHIDLIGTGSSEYLKEFFLMALTILGIVGMTNAVNIIDGLNGLAAGLALIIFVILGLFFNEARLFEMANFSYALAVICLGFWALNFPAGYIFLGDGGSYFLGFMVAALCIFANGRVPEVSSWAYVLLCAYPVVETFNTILRRIYVGVNWSEPDNQHLHQLVLQFLHRKELFVRRDWKSNAAASLTCLVLGSAPVLVAFYFRAQSKVLLISLVLFVFVYVAFYRIFYRLRFS